MRRSRSLASAAAAVLALSLLAACSGGGSEDAAPSTLPISAPPEPEPVVVAPLTGLPLDDEDVLDRPALVVKIDNHNRDARPQVGLDVADVVFEELVEGGATRFAALFHSTDADPVGPVRSARTTDVDIVANLNRPLFAWSGANTGVSRQIRSAALVDLGWDAVPAEYYRSENRRAPNNVFTHTSALFDLAPDDAAAPPSLFRFRGEHDPAPGGTEVDGVSMNFRGSNGLVVEWMWDPASSTWLRTQMGTPHVVESGTQIGAHNVVIQFTGYHSSGFVDTGGAASPEAELVGEGEAWIFTDGKLVRGTWRRPDPGAVTTYLGSDGREVLLTPGRTWVELPPPGQASVIEPPPPSTTAPSAAVD